MRPESLSSKLNYSLTPYSMSSVAHLSPSSKLNRSLVPWLSPSRKLNRSLTPYSMHSVTHLTSDTCTWRCRRNP